MSSVAVAGYGFGAAIWIPIETAFVNPNNIDPIAIDPNATNSDKYENDIEISFASYFEFWRKLQDKISTKNFATKNENRWMKTF